MILQIHSPKVKAKDKDKDSKQDRPHLGRRSLSGSRSPQVVPSKGQPYDAVKLKFSIETPPLVLYGVPEESTGTLLSGVFEMTVQATEVPVRNVHIAIVQRVRSKREPVHSNPAAHTHLAGKPCSCTTRAEIARWEVLPHPARLPKTTHAYPFSHLLPGSLPATSHNSVFDVEYFLVAEAQLDAVSSSASPLVYAANSSPRMRPSSGTSGVAPSPPPVMLVEPLKIERAIIKPVPERKSVRVFPPTELSAHMTLPSLAYPHSTFTVELALTGISVSSSAHCRWKMRKINWRLDETARHGDIADVRVVGSGEIKEGWKTDFEGTGKVEAVLDSLAVSKTANCAIDDPTLDLHLSHTLVMEMVVAEEMVATKSVSGRTMTHVSPTGAARVLRMQFAFIVTERSGLGIAWDDEVPPTYSNVPLSPPDYTDIVASLPRCEDMPADGFVEGINERLTLSQL